MFDLNFVKNNGNTQESIWLWKLLPLVGTIVGTFLGFILGNKQAKRKEYLSDKRYFAYITQLIEECERIGIQTIESLEELVDNYDYSDNNSLVIPSLSLFEKFEKLDHSRVFDILFRHKEFSNETFKNEIQPSAVFDLINHISYVSVGSDGLHELLEFNNKQINTLREKFISYSGELYKLIYNNKGLDQRLMKVLPPSENKKGDSREFKLLKPNEFVEIVIPVIESELDLKPESFDEIKLIKPLIHKCKETYANIEKSNSFTYSSPSGGLVERKLAIEKSVKKISLFIDTYLFRTRTNESEMETVSDPSSSDEPSH